MTSHGEPRPCPLPEVLHRFIEGTLERITARDVAKHTETCRDCRFIVRGTMEFLREDGELLTEDPSEPSSFGRGWWLALAAAATTVFVILWFFAPTDPGRRFDRALTTTPMRPMEGRLSTVPYAEYRAHRGEGESAVPARLEVLAREVLEGTPPSDAREWHRKGAASLLAGDPVAAINAFERATELDVRNARYRSDLAAARIAWGTQSRDPGVLADATRDAQTALKLAPDLPEAHFNLALSFQRRGLFKEAQMAYNQYQEFDSSSAWASEARSRIEKLR